MKAKLSANALGPFALCGTHPCTGTTRALTHKHTNKRARARAHTHRQTCTHARTHARTHTHSRTRTHTHACMHTRKRMHAHTHACMHTRKRMHAHTQTHACTHKRMHAPTRIYTQTHAHAHAHAQTCARAQIRMAAGHSLRCNRCKADLLSQGDNRNLRGYNRVRGVGTVSHPGPVALTEVLQNSPTQCAALHATRQHVTAQANTMRQYGMNDETPALMQEALTNLGY